MSDSGLLVLLIVMVAILLVVGVGVGVGVLLIGLRWRRSRPGRAKAATTVPAPAPPVASSSAASPSSAAPSSAVPAARAETPKGDVAADDPRIIALGLEPPVSTDAVFRNIDRIKPLLRAEAAESDRLARVTPLAGRALRATGVFAWCVPASHGGLEASYADRLEAVSQIARIDVGMGWVVVNLSAHGELTGSLDDAGFAELYPEVDHPTVFASSPFADAVELADGSYHLEPARWRLGSGGFHAERWVGAVRVWDGFGRPVLNEDGIQKLYGIWLPHDKVRQLDDWNPTGLRSSGSASFELTEAVDIPPGRTFDLIAERRAYHLPFAGIAVGAAQHLVDLTLEALRTKRRNGARLGSRNVMALTEALALLDMLVLGLRGYMDYIDRAFESRDVKELSHAELTWMLTNAIPVRATLERVRDLTADVYGTGYVRADSEFGRVLRDIHVAMAHALFRTGDFDGEPRPRVERMLDDPETFVPIWDLGVRAHQPQVA